VETIDGDKTLTLEDSGKFFLLDNSSLTTITLPELSNNLIGITYKFVVKTANTNGYKIVTGNIADSGGDDFIGYCMVGTDNAAGSTDAGTKSSSRHDHQGNTSTENPGSHNHDIEDEDTIYIENSGFSFPVQTFHGNGRMVAPAANDCVIFLDSNDGADGGGLAGTTVKLTAVTSTLWYAEVLLFSASSICNPTNVFTDID